MRTEWWAGWRTAVVMFAAAVVLTMLLVVVIDWVPHH
jgi:hypothetical protein